MSKKNLANKLRNSIILALISIVSLGTNMKKITALYVFLADKVLIKSLENYVSSGDRSLLNIIRLKKNTNKRKTVHFLDDSDDESQKKVK